MGEMCLYGLKRRNNRRKQTARGRMIDELRGNTWLNSGWGVREPDLDSQGP